MNGATTGLACVWLLPPIQVGPPLPGVSLGYRQPTAPRACWRLAGQLDWVGERSVGQSGRLSQNPF